MGTNVYLEWTGKTPTEQHKQLRAKSRITAGNIGYLWASIHMLKENAVLQLLFPDKYWRERSTDEYDFKANFENLAAIAHDYLASVAEGRDMKLPGEVQQRLANMKKTAGIITQALRKSSELTGQDGAGLYCGQLTDIKSAVTWLRSVFAFFCLGIKRQGQGLKPYPRIDW